MSQPLGYTRGCHSPPIQFLSSRCTAPPYSVFHSLIFSLDRSFSINRGLIGGGVKAESSSMRKKSSGAHTVSMENLLGLLRIHVIRGINLAVRDVSSSDPYVKVRMGKQKLKTRVVRKNVNPEWNEDLTLSISDPNIPIKMQVYDRDTFSPDDKMGDAEFDIGPFMEAVKMRLENVPSGTIITTVKPTRQNCLGEESTIVWENGKVKQHMFLRLQNVERGEIEVQLEWIDVPGSKVV